MGPTHKNYLFLIFTIILVNSGLFAQDFKWLRTDHAKKSGLIVYGITGEESGGCTYLVLADSLYNTTSLNDTVTFDTMRFFLNNGHGSYLVRVDTSGKVIQAKMIGTFVCNGVCRDSNENFYVIGVNVAVIDHIKSLQIDHLAPEQIDHLFPWRRMSSS